MLINPYRKLGLFEKSGCKYALANLGGAQECILKVSFVKDLYVDLGM